MKFFALSCLFIFEMRAFAAAPAFSRVARNNETIRGYESDSDKTNFILDTVNQTCLNTTLISDEEKLEENALFLKKFYHDHDEVVSHSNLIASRNHKLHADDFFLQTALPNGCQSQFIYGFDT